MAYQPGPIPIDARQLSAYLERELRRIANAQIEALDTARVNLAAGPTWVAGAGTPEGAVFAPKGSLYSRTDGGALTCLYVKESAGTLNTGWAAK
jgi:hypothetical protein